MTQSCDFFVIGGGSGGVRAARIAAELGAKVVLAENQHLGGTCVNIGCIPKKLLVYASSYRHAVEDAKHYGWHNATIGDFDWPAFVARKDAYIARLQGSYAKTLANAGVQVVDGNARFADPHTIQVGSQHWRAKHILIATGGVPVVPDIPGARVHGATSTDMFSLPGLPEHIVVVGGGYIAVEFAGIFRAFGVRVTQLYRGEMFLRGFDDDVRAHLAEQMRQQGVDLRFNANPAAVDAGGVTLENGERIAADCVLFATGRKPAIEGLGLKHAGVSCKPGGAIIVDGDDRTSAKHIYAVGDVSNNINLTPVAIKQGQALSMRLFGKKNVHFDDRLVPTAVFSDPPIAQVGLSESQARKESAAQGGDIAVFKTTVKPMKYGFANRKQRALIKIITEKKTDKVLGVHLVGSDAPEIMQTVATALRLGATKADLDATVAIHPTLAEELVTLR